LHNFFTEFSVPFVRFSNTEPDKGTESYKVYLEEKLRKRKPELVVGREDVVNVFVGIFEMAPDLIVQTKRSQVKVKEGDDGSVVDSDISIKGTQLFQLVYADAASVDDDGNKEDLGCVAPKERTARVVWDKSNKPVDFQMDGKFHMILDEMNRIVGVHMKVNYYRSTPITVL